MKMKDVRNLTKEDKIIHRHYGLCTVEEILWSRDALFGIVVSPDSQDGQNLLNQHTGTTIPRLLEDSIRRLQLAPSE